MENQILISFLSSLIVILIIYNDIKKTQLRDKSFNNFTKIFTIFEAIKETSYNKIFKEEILVFTTSGFKYNKDELDVLTRKYVKLVMVSCGNEIINDLIRIYGDIEPLTISLANDFINKVLQDESEITTSIKDNIE